jgi:cysteine desulfurase/selenocysteine lyase
VDVRDQFPAIAGWHYLDSAVSAQKPQAVIDAITRAYAADYASVHRGVYQRSADMTLAYEAARGPRRQPHRRRRRGDDLHPWRDRGDQPRRQVLPKEGRSRVLLSALEHHSNIVPWQLAGYAIDVVPLTADGRIDLDAAEAMIGDQHRVVSFAHVSNVLGSILDAKRAAEIAHSKGALLLLDGCQSAPRWRSTLLRSAPTSTPIRAQALRPDRHRRAVGPQRLLESMPPWQGGGRDDRQRVVRAHHLLPRAAAVRGGHPAHRRRHRPCRRDRLGRGIGVDRLHAHEAALVAECREALRDPRLRPPVRAGGKRRHRQLRVEGVHPHDVGTILDDDGVAIRAGHHCAQPLMQLLGVPPPAAPASPRTATLATSRRSRGLEESEADLRMNEQRKIEVDEVDACKNRRAPASTRKPRPETFERKRDYLSGFLAEPPAQAPVAGAGSDLQARSSRR